MTEHWTVKQRKLRTRIMITHKDWDLFPRTKKPNWKALRDLVKSKTAPRTRKSKQ